MATTSFFNHYSQNGSSPYDRIEAVFPAVSIAGELIAAGWTSMRQLLAQFMWCDLISGTMCEYHLS